MLVLMLGTADLISGGLCIAARHAQALGKRVCVDAQHEAVEQFIGNAKRYIAGQPLENIVDKRAGY